MNSCITLTGVRGRSIQEEKGGPEEMKAEKHLFCVFHAEYSGMANYRDSR